MRPRTPGSRRQPRFPSASRGRAVILVQFLSALSALLGLLAVGGLVAYEYKDELEDARSRGEMVAGVLEDRVTQTIEAASLTLRTLEESIALEEGADPSRARALLRQSLMARPYLREVAVLDLSGNVLSSTEHSAIGRRIDLKAFGPLPSVGADMLMPLMRGRGIADLIPGPEARRPDALTMLPLLRRIQLPNGRGALLLAVINPDVLVNLPQLSVADGNGLAMLCSYTGQVITAVDSTAILPGQQLAQHPVFKQWLPAHEHGSYIGPGALPGTQVVAFRVSRTRPLVVLVEQSKEASLALWRQQLPWLVGFCVAGIALIAVSSRVVLRSLHAREANRKELERAHAKVALREREMSVVMKSVQELIFRTDASGDLTFVNARWSAISEQGAEAALGRRLSDVVVKSDRAQVDALFQLDDHAGVRTAEVSVLTRSDVHYRFAVSTVPLRSRGRIVGFAGSAVDVSDRFIARRDLQRQLAFTGQLLEVNPLPVSMFDAQRRYVTVNQAWEDFTGLKRADIIGTPVGRTMRADEIALAVENDARLLAEGGSQRYEMQLTHRDGSRRDMVISKVLVPSENGEPAGILCTLMDVSEFRDAERATREARDAAEEASRVKSEFIANISHELRTPLQSILGFSELGILRGTEQPKLLGMFNDIHASGQRMLALVNDLLDVSKIESPVGTFDLERCDLRAQVHSVLRELGPLLADRGLNVNLSLPDEALSAKVDPVRFQQVIRNVMANAIRFSPHGASIDLAARPTLQGEAHITVADRGPGIPPSELGSIFEAFVQSSQTKDGSGGTGLGLAICRKIVEIHGGRIDAENRAGSGAIFHIHLPIRVTGDTQLDSQLSTIV